MRKKIAKASSWKSWLWGKLILALVGMVMLRKSYSNLLLMVGAVFPSVVWLEAKLW